MRVSRLSSCVLLALSAAVEPASVCADVFQDAVFWWRGGCDFDKDGVLDDGEFVDSRHAKGDAAWQCSEPSGSEGGILFSRQDVVSQYHAMTNEATCLTFQSESAASASIVLPNLAQGYTEDTRLGDYTAWMRVRLDDIAESSTTAMLFNLGYNWSSKTGVSVGFYRAAGSDTIQLRVVYGQNQIYPEGVDTATLLAGRVGEWQDLFVTLQYGGKLTVQSAGPDGQLTELFNRTLSTGSKCETLRIGSGAPCSILTGGFIGSISQFAFWQRALLTAERYEAMRSPMPAACTWRLGVEDGTANEFASGVTASSVTNDASEAWDEVNPELTAQNPSVNIRFLPTLLKCVRSNGTGYDESMAQAIRIVTTPDSGKCRLEVSIDGNHIDTVTVRPGKEQLVFIPPERLFFASERVASITRVDDSPVPCRIDVIEMRGSWQLGRHYYSRLSPSSEFHGESNPYVLEGGNWKKDMSGGIVMEGSTYSSTSVKFELSDALAGCSYQYGVAMNQTKNSASIPLIMYVNGEEFWTGTIAQYSGARIEIPAGTFTGGENVIEWRYDADFGSTWAGFRGAFLLVKTVPEDINGTVITLR